MQLYEQKFEEALAYLSRPDILNPTGDRPICYVNYDVEDAMEVYRMIPPFDSQSQISWLCKCKSTFYWQNSARVYSQS